MSRGKKIALGVIAALVAVAGVVLALLPTIAERALTQKVEELMSERSEALTWETFEVGGFQRTVSLTQLDARAPEFGVTAHVDAVEVAPKSIATFREDPALDSIRVQGASMRVDLATLKQRLSSEGSRESHGEGRAKKAGGFSSRLRRALLQTPPEVDLSNVRLTLAWGKRDVFSVVVEEGRVARDGAELALRARGTLGVVLELVPKFLREEKTWALDGVFLPEERRAKVALGSQDERDPLLKLQAPNLGEVQIHTLDVDASLPVGRGLEVHVVARRLEAALGSLTLPVVSMRAKETAVELRGGRPHVSMSGAIVEVDPTRLGELGEIQRQANHSQLRFIRRVVAGRGLDEQTDDARGNEDGPGAEGSGVLTRVARIAARIVPLLWRVDVEVTQSTFRLALFEAHKATRRITLAEGVDARSVAGRLSASGKSAGGDFDAAALFEPGAMVPRSATLVLDGVEVDALSRGSRHRKPGVRGARGEVGGHLDATIAWIREGSGPHLEGLGQEATLTYAFDWRDGRVDFAGLSEEALTGIELFTEASVTWSPATALVRLSDGVVRYNGLQARYKGSLRDWPLKPLLKFYAQMDEAKCHDMVHALPDGLLGPLRDVVLRGKASPSVDIRYPLLEPRRFKIVLDGLAKENNPQWRRDFKRANPSFDGQYPANKKTWLCKVEHLRWQREERPVIYRAGAQGSLTQNAAYAQAKGYTGTRADGDVSWLESAFYKEVVEGVSDKREQPLYVGPAMSTFVPLKHMPRHVGAAAYLSEEILFYSNRGVSMPLIQKALRIDLERNRYVYGGSTVTQQLVKNLFLTRKKTLARKLQEALIALRIDEVISKDRLLELYLNCIEFGYDLYGIGPAAQYYFQRPATELTAVQSVFLAILKPSPKFGFQIVRRRTTPTEGWIPKRFETLFKRLVEYEILTQQEADAQRPYVLKWDAEGNYIDPEPRLEPGGMDLDAIAPLLPDP
ncbi:MAG: biosynthetic peptidoglycan transglycosylase [Myxococcota bacterium]